MLSRRILLGGLIGAAGASAGAAGARDLRRVHPLKVEPLEIVTGSGKVERFQVEIADNDATRERGLMFRKSLGPNAGMLFDFKTGQQVYFWMKNTLIPLDMVFIDAIGRVTNVYAMAKPLSLAPIASDGVVLGVLEIAGGRAAELGIMEGDLVRNRMFGNL